ncbi:1-aminocyclopropane-1-carboxylate oxidase 1 [Impatiens glandulifera]|uniref:1-aminocyclopropane-1-carboxylate oxidase 1 n=1 Tax=Impatiens glandulifera TaxID=253017 RepID=UPI001FB17C6A|nr:1-aminocyclopropane-1-carboxylate oxidase 1 [Impatiens glandulifera]
MEVPVIDFKKLDGDDDEQRAEAMAILHEASEKWGCFMIENHGLDYELMGKVKQLVNQHYDDRMKKNFYESEIVKGLEIKTITSDSADWETTFFVCHRPNSNINELPNLPEDFGKTMDAYIEQLINLAEKLSELMCVNLGLDKNFIKESFKGSKGPTVGTKVAKYPKCPQPELIRGLREHTDAGGIILLLQDDQVPGLQFLKDGKCWMDIPPSKNNGIFVNTGDQIEVLSNGRYKSVVHRVMADKEGSRLSIATFYNPAGDAVISPATELMYPEFRFQDYLNYYGKTKFGEKSPRFQKMKEISNVHA